MSKTYTFHDYPFMANAGRDDEFEIVVDVTFNATARTGDYYDKAMGCWYPGDPAELEIIGVKFSTADKAKFSPEQLVFLADAIMDYAAESDADAFWEKAADHDGRDEYDADCAAEARREDARMGW